MMKPIRKFFRGLHWKLTLSYTLVTVAALLVVQMIAVVLIWAVVSNSNIYPRALIAVVKEELVPQIAVYLDDPEPDIRGLVGWLKAAETSAGLTFQSLNFPVAQVSLSDFDENTNLLVLDENLNLLAGIPASIIQDHIKIIDQAKEAIATARSGEDDPNKITKIIKNESMTVAVPVMNEDQQLLGLVVLKTVYPPRGILVGMISYIGGSLIFFTIAAGAVGSLFGFITARGLTRRLYKVTQVTYKWSQGDFSSFIQERSEDEISQLARKLNRMAEQLQNLLHTRQELAALEERNRLARDLHDSVKQQVFATAMKVGAARELIGRDPATASKHLDDAEQLARQAQVELTTIIRELHSATYDEENLVQAIRKYVTEWSRLNQITANVNVTAEPILPTHIRETLYRVSQEALSNVSKHSQATQVEINLCWENDGFAVQISDNGKGFDIYSIVENGLGLQSMRERLTSLGGRIRVESKPGDGVLVYAWCPIPKEG